MLFFFPENHAKIMIFHNYVPYVQQLNNNKKSRSVFAVGKIILSRVSVSIRTVSQSGRFCVSKGKIKHHPLSYCKEAEGCEKIRYSGSHLFYIK